MMFRSLGLIFKMFFFNDQNVNLQSETKVTYLYESRSIQFRRWEPQKIFPQKCLLGHVYRRKKRLNYPIKGGIVSENTWTHIIQLTKRAEKPQR